MSTGPIRTSPEVGDALAGGRAVVALESTIFSTLGLPEPANREAYARCVAALRAGGAVPALCAVLDGVPTLGADGALDRVLGGTRKIAERDLPVAVAGGVDVGVTTVSATLAMCSVAGVGVFATGGMGGVHRGAERTGDISADLGALTRHRVVLVSAGAKAILDLPRTLEALETLGVPVVGLGTDTLPAFYSRSSGLPLPHRVDSAAGVAPIAAAAWAMGWPGGVLVANPVPLADEIPADEIEGAIGAAISAADEAGIAGAALTPYLLGHIAGHTAGRGVAANLALAENNASVAAAIAVELAAGDRG